MREPSTLGSLPREPEGTKGTKHLVLVYSRRSEAYGVVPSQGTKTLRHGLVPTPRTIGVGHGNQEPPQ